MPAEATGASLTAGQSTGTGPRSASESSGSAVARRSYDRGGCARRAPPSRRACSGRSRRRRGREHRSASNTSWKRRRRPGAGRLEAIRAERLRIFEHSATSPTSCCATRNWLDEDRAAVLSSKADELGDVALRRFYRRQMLRIQSESILQGAPIFETLGKTSALADFVIARRLPRSRRSAASRRRPDDGDRARAAWACASSISGRTPTWSSSFPIRRRPPSSGRGVAERIIHTRQLVHRRRRDVRRSTRACGPNGREGDLVQSESAYKNYFEHHAEAWEGITYMKSRAVAGNLERATAFLHELQQVDWRRYGQSMRSREELAQMRARLEKEQGAAQSAEGRGRADITISISR